VTANPQSTIHNPQSAPPLSQTTDSDRQLAELDALDRETHPHFLAVDFSRGEVEFLQDMRTLRDRHGDLSSPSAGLTPPQAGWLEAIHRKAAQQCRQADMMDAGRKRRPVNMSKYSIGA